MSLYILDTDIITLLRFGHPAVSQRVARHSAGDLAITIITVEEQLTGWYTQLRRAKNSKSQARGYQHLTDQVKFIAQLSIISFTEPAILRYEPLKSQKLKVGKKDLAIAAIVLEIRAVLVSRNSGDFKRVPNLQVQDWSI
jgi:tRNA(fMet)-specific endonuclease VapC